MARPRGFEPLTCGFEVRRSIRAELRARKIRTGLLIGNRQLIVKDLSKRAWSMGHGAYSKKPGVRIQDSGEKKSRLTSSGIPFRQTAECRTRNFEYRSNYFIILRFFVLLFDIRYHEPSVICPLASVIRPLTPYPRLAPVAGVLYPCTV